jgi:hypothetical protein
MKHVLAIATFAALFLNSSIVRSAPSWLPSGANYVIHRHWPTAPNLRGKWEKVAEYTVEGGYWGQGQCQPGGTECHLYDWVTYWVNEVYVQYPDPNNYDGPVVTGVAPSFPAGYNPSTGLYFF